MAPNRLMRFFHHLFNDPLKYFWGLLQRLISCVLSPAPPASTTKLGRPRIAIIGAGLTGVSSAAHCVERGFDVSLFEAGGQDALGGIWAKFRGAKVIPTEEVLSMRWRSCGDYDGVIAAPGTCGEPKYATIKGEEKFRGKIFHSSQLDGKEQDAEGQNVLVIGGGASAIEALEFASASGAAKTYVLSRSEKWIMPRNPVIEVSLALIAFGQETMSSFIPNRLLRLFFYRDLQDMAPAGNSGKRLFMDTPKVNNDILEQIRGGRASWLRGDMKSFERHGIRCINRSQGTPKGGPGREEVIEGDICIMATGYERPSLKSLPHDSFEKNYEPPNWYLQVFPPKHIDVCCINCTYINAIGAVGNWHIGIYTRFLLLFVVNPLARPTEGRMERCIDWTRWIKRFAPTGAFDLVTYLELVYWFVFVILINPFRWKWALFVLTGRGSALPKAVVETEDRVRERYAKMW